MHGESRSGSFVRYFEKVSTAMHTEFKQVQMKEQILKGLLLQRKDEEDGNAMDGLGIGGDVRVATMSHAGGAAGVDADVDAASRCDGELQRREELIKSGAITPLDDLTGAPTTLAPTRSRMTLMDHKIAEGMTVKLPRSRRRPSRSSISQRGLASAEPGSEVLLTDKTANTTVQCPICTQNVRVDQPCNPDEILSKHMDRCSRRSGRKRRDKQNRVSSQAEMNDKPRAGEECASFQRPRRSVASADTEVHTTMDPPNGTSSTYSNRATSAKRRRAGGREGTREGTRVDTATSVNDTDGSLKVLAGSQLLVDDFDDEDFEARKASQYIRWAWMPICLPTDNIIGPPSCKYVVNACIAQSSCPRTRRLLIDMLNRVVPRS